MLTRALHRKPERRYANAGEFRAALEKPAAPPPPVKPQRKAGDIYTNSLGMKFAWIPPARSSWAARRTSRSGATTRRSTG